MNAFKNIISHILLIVFLTPMTINSLHVHKDKEHVSCDKNDATHLHQLHDDDCGLYHFQLANTLLFHSKFKRKSVIKNNVKTIFNYLSFYKNKQNSLKSLRGPPYLLVA